MLALDWLSESYIDNNSEVVVGPVFGLFRLFYGCY